MKLDKFLAKYQLGEGFEYYFAGNRQGESNTHISMLNEVGPYDWAPTRKKSHILS